MVERSDRRRPRAILALADGRVFRGESFGSSGEVAGEVVFNTSMTGYQEILSDPSYCGQIVTLTYPLIGNYGTNDRDVESKTPVLSGFVVKEYIDHPSNWRSDHRLDEYLKEKGIVAIQGIDTRALTRHIRDSGAQMGFIATDDYDEKAAVEKARQTPALVGRDLVKEVTCKAPYRWSEGKTSERSVIGPKVVVYDFGVKYNILRRLAALGCEVMVVPADTPAMEAIRLKPQGILFSNGPGDPEAVDYAVNIVKELVGKKPIMGVCLGHQILALALGAKTYKLKFGHHGGNQPVMDLLTRKVEITAQNHGFAVDLDSINDQVELTHINLNDRTVEGMRHRSLPIFSVQYHPEAGPGPNDSQYLFSRFMEMIKNA